MGKKNKTKKAKKAKKELVVTLEEFGGRIDDKNFDNRPALQRAMDFLSNHGGGILRPGKRGYTYFNGSIEQPSGPDHVTIEFFSFCNVDTTSYSSEYAKRDIKIRALLDDILVDCFVNGRPNDEDLSIEDIVAHTERFKDYLDRIYELGL